MKKVFISYSHKDEPFKDELKTHLKVLSRLGKIKIWDDRAIDAGDEWNVEIMKALEEADIILLLISNYFIASDFCYDIELKRALERYEANKEDVKVVPIILRPCEWQGLPFGKLQAEPKDAKPITEWGNEDEAYTFIAKRISAIV